jgi:RNA polymerase subunit RPABC4/transcription elongation factor Spt4
MAWSESEQYQEILNGNYVHKIDSSALVLTGPVGRVCPSCGQVANVEAPFCLACGVSLKGARRVCAKCGIRVFKDWQTCPGCGSSLIMPVEEQGANNGQ